MTAKESADNLQNCLWTIKMLAEALVEDDSRQGSSPEAILSIRATAGIHDAIRLIADMADEKCEDLKGYVPQLRHV